MTKSFKFSAAAIGVVAAFGLTACSSLPWTQPATEPASLVAEETSKAKLAAILAAQPEAVQARFDARNPAETMSFFGIEPGMTVVEALPGGGWYSKILIPYLGEEGQLVGAHYPDAMWSKFGFSPEWVAKQVEGSNTWVAATSEWNVTGAEVSDFKLTEMPADMSSQVDAVLFIRALHNLNRFNTDGSYMTDTLTETFKMLKPGGVVGVVQHRAPEANPDAWADGSNGYLKTSYLIKMFEKAGFKLEAESELNANPKDQPTTEDFVWRLPQSLASTKEGTPERAAMEAIGESDRMTLRFRKPV